MQKLGFIVIIALLFVKAVLAQNDVNEGRITEHAVFSFIAVAGLLTLTYFVRKSRLRSLNED